MKKNGKLWILGGILAMIALSCGGSDDGGNNGTDDDGPIVVEDSFIRASDMSFVPEIEGEGVAYTSGGTAEDPLVTLKDAGCNTIRIRLWKDPATVHSGMAEVKALAARVKALGMKVWLTVHYSDTWADPGNQEKPGAWEGLSMEQLKTAAQEYTSTILTEIDPDIIQIGNETNSGFIYPEGNLIQNEQGFLTLVSAISSTIRIEAPDTKIMLHYAGIGSGAEWFFNKVASVDYDYIGLSYYPVWHGKDLGVLASTINTLGATHNKKVLIAETAYPFTLGWNDYTNNIVGEEGQLVPGYTASVGGQLNFLLELREILETSEQGAGFAYWGGEWIAFRGPTATNGSSFENQALWDFDNNAVPAMVAFKKEP